MRIFDTVSDAAVTVVDVRAGLLSPTLDALRDIEFLDSVKQGQLTFIVLHVVGSSIASLEGIEDTVSSTTGGKYFLVKNFVNDSSFFGHSADSSSRVDGRDLIQRSWTISCR